MTTEVTPAGAPSQYPIGPRETVIDKIAIKEAFSRKVAVILPRESHFGSDSQSLSPREVGNAFNKSIAERHISKVPSLANSLKSVSLHQTQWVSSDKNQQAPASHNLINGSVLMPDRPDENNLELENNPFLKKEGKKLSKATTELIEDSTQHRFQELAKKVLKLTTVSRAFNRQNSLDEHVLVGFDKVANYENQGIPPDYIEQTQAVADRENVIIAIRPVEKICKTLIEEGYSSKPLSIKGKSSNWGPMAGFIPVNQHYSKLSGNSIKVDEFNKINHQAVNVDRVANKEQLHISSKRIDELKQMNILNNVVSIQPEQGYTQAIVFDSAPKNNAGPTEKFEAHQKEDGQWAVFSGSGDSRKALDVIPVTADFDLLFVHSHYEDVDLGQQDRYGPSDPVLGIYSRRKLEVINALNKEFDRVDNPMVHHGADSKNPYTDMKANIPATVMIPKSMIGKLGVYTDSPVLIKTEEELAKLYRAMRDSGIKIEVNPLWKETALNGVNREVINQKINHFNNVSKK